MTKEERIKQIISTLCELEIIFERRSVIHSLSVGCKDEDTADLLQHEWDWLYRQLGRDWWGNGIIW